jgi:ATP-binding cassette subfamily C protein
MTSASAAILGTMQRPVLGDTSEDAVTDPTSAQVFQKEAWRSVHTHIVFVVIFSAAINVLYLAPSLFMLQVYDRVLPSGATLTLVFMTGVLILALFCMSRLDALRGRLLVRASLRIERLGASAVMQESLLARRRGISGPLPGIRELDTLRQGLSSPAAIGLLDLPWTPLFIGVCFLLHFWIGSLALAGAAVILFIALLNQRASRRALSSISGKTNQFYAAHDGDLGAAESLYALGAERSMMTRRLQLRSEVVDAQTDAAMTGAEFSATTKAVRLFLQSAALALGAYLAIERQISPGAIIAASILTARAYAPVEQIVGGWRQIAMARSAYRDLRQMFAAVGPTTVRTPLPVPVGRVQLDGVSSAPAGATALTIRNISFTAEPGEIIGIVGPSGAGKTTLARILANAVEPRAGAIRIDGARYVDWDAAELSKHIGYLPQRVDLFDGTVSENISCFALDAGENMEDLGPKIVEAAKLAGAHDLILGLPNGYETRLGHGGSGISPGQAQRIALARALFGEPVVVVLDEPNAHLDADGEGALIAALQACRARGALCFVIAHRVGVLSIVDKIMVLNNGQVADFGPRSKALAAVPARLPNNNSNPMQGAQS